MSTPIDFYYQPAKNTNKQTIVFCHGYAASYTYHSPFSKQLSDNDYYAVILPGHGKELDVERSEMKVSHYGKLLADWILEKKLTNIVLMGHSMGGAVAAVACKYLPKDVVNKLIVVAPMNKASSGKGHIFLTKFHPTRLANHKHLRSFSSVLYYDRTSPYDNPVNGEELFKQELEYYQAHKKGFKYLHLNMILPSEMSIVTKAYKALNVPTYLIVGEKDGILPVDATIKKLSKWVNNLTAIKMLRTGHLMFEERPVDYFKIVMNIINGAKLQSIY